MIKEFNPITQGILALIKEWEPKLLSLSKSVILDKFNDQDRSIKQILGHMVDSATNITHRIVHMQYQPSPIQYPNYATNGNNDRWIAIQNYQNQDWENLIQIWKYTNIHIVHVIENINQNKLESTWPYSSKKLITLKEGVIDYLRHLKLHLNEIEDLL